MGDQRMTDAGRAAASSYGTVETVKGDRSGDSFASTSELERQKNLDAFRKEKGWGGIAGAARAPKGPEFDKQFGDWMKAKTVNAGQKKALAATE
jgi:hypothetical protein